MPGRIIDGDDDLGRGTGRIRPGNISEMPDKGRLEPLLFTVPSLHLAVGGLIEQTRRQLPCHEIEGRKTVDKVLVIPGPDQRPVPLHPQGGAQRRHEGKPRFVLAQQHARSCLGFFLTPSVLLGPPVAAPDCRADSDTSADRDGWHGAGRTPAWPCASPRCPWSDRDASPVLHRSSWLCPAHTPGDRLAPM